MSIINAQAMGSSRWRPVCGSARGTFVGIRDRGNRRPPPVAAITMDVSRSPVDMHFSW